LKKIAGQIDLISAGIIGLKPLNTILAQPLGKQVKFTNVKPLTAEEYAKAVGLTDTTSQLFLKPKIKVDPILNVTPPLENLDKYSKQFSDKMAEMARLAKESFKKNYIVWGDALTSGLTPAIVDLGAALRQGLGDSFSSIGEALGNAISGGGLSDVLNGIINAMSQFIINFGKQLVEAGTLALIAQKSLIANPYLAIAAGIAAIAVGSALKNSVPKLATGGITNGPTLALIGDNPGGREAVVPSKDWREAFGGMRSGDLNVTGEFVLRNDVLVAAVQRGQSGINRYQ
jgi:hypothetical protein